MAMCVCEFEFVQSKEGGVLCWPFWPGREDGTFGTNWADAIGMAADWLRSMALDLLMRDETFPGLPLDNQPIRGGRVVVVAVEASLTDVPAVTAKEAASLLDVSDARVAQLCHANQLESWKVGRTRMVSLASVKARLADGHKAGRPRKSTVSTA